MGQNQFVFIYAKNRLKLGFQGILGVLGLFWDSGMRIESVAFGTLATFTMSISSIDEINFVFFKSIIFFKKRKKSVDLAMGTEAQICLIAINNLHKTYFNI